MRTNRRKIKRENTMSTQNQERTTAPIGDSPQTGSSSKKQSVLSALRPQDFNRTGKLGSNCAVALEALWANRLRSLLTTLGIFIGVAAVIASLFLTQGITAYFMNTVTSLGTNTIAIAPGPGSNTSSSGGPRPASRPVQPVGETTLSLTSDDAKQVATIANVAAVSPVISVNEQIISSDQNWNTQVQGVDPSFQNIRNWRIAEGAWFSTQDDQDARAVAVLGDTVAQNLFGVIGEDPIGKTIRVGNQVYRVIGVLRAKGSNQDDVIFVPFLSAQYRLKNNGYVDQIVVQVDDISNIDSVQQKITRLLEQHHHISTNMADDFNLTNSTQLLQTVTQLTSLTTLLLVGIAGISLSVGGVGIMNIMIVSVTERTREIGIRISIGAQREDIRSQFLIEALTLSLLGGVIGLFIGFLIGLGVTNVLDVPFIVSPISLIMPFAISAAIGVLFGFYPAARAAALDPIDALRSL
jgi:putative ABC transport system permease protein